MIYGPRDCQVPAHVYDMDAGGAQILQVLQIDTGVGEVLRAQSPLRAECGEVATKIERFRAIYAFPEHKPTLFHCYGRLTQ